MNAIKTARRLIARDPDSPGALSLASLVLALESESRFDVERLYELDGETFELAIQILKEWRIDRYYAGKAKLFDLSYQVNQLPPPLKPLDGS